MKNYLYYSFRQMSLLLIGAILYTASSAQGFSPQVQARLQHIIDSFQNHSDTALIGGISAAINVDGLALWKGASGYAARNIDEQNNLLPGGTPLTPDTLFRTYSITKTFTAALTLELAHEGVFNLDDPESKYIPWIVIANPELNTNVTIRQLLAHESGYSDYLLEPNQRIAFAIDPTHVWTPFEMLSFVHQIAPPGPPGVYSSTNYIVLGAIIEAATGTPVEQLFRERYFNKLHLNSMYLAGREPIDGHGNLAAPHDNIAIFDPIFQETGQPYTFPDTVTNISRLPASGQESLGFTSGGIVSNVVDVTKWSNDLFGGRATSKAVLDTMLNSIPPYADGDGDHLGYGIFYNTRISATDTFIGHAGIALGYESLMYYQPNRKMTIAILINNAMADRYAIARMLYEALPDFLCGEKEKRVQVCFQGYSVCIPRVAARYLIKYGAYLGGCVGCKGAIENTDSLLTAVLSPSELATLGIPKVISGKNELIAYPNPISKSGVLSFMVAKSGIASLRIYDMSGRQVSLLFNGMAESGVVRQVHFNANNLTPGMYIAHLQTKDGTVQKKLVVTR